ncbi:putative ferric reductase [Humitalea rosea]|uniref:Putative ferric reductase n=1 Tax=Humitalea rosea TaxID=990373 RepID=A0A2W7J6H0_9PROT|nr:ferric reductase-like transmembrane domain-containing protein [Humitalea rosea]PZW46802.1 putative ferric reductase [Humitalea rosea]
MPVPLLLALLALLILLPAALGWALVGPARPWPDEVAGALGLLGFAALLVAFLLSGRFRAISARAGIDRSMRWHQLLARVLTVALLLHPFFYTLPEGRIFLWPNDVTRAGALQLDAGEVVTGMLAWLLLALLTLTAIFRDSLPYRYESWRLLHGVGALLVAVLGLLHALGAGRYAAHPAVGGALLGLGALAALTMIWVWLVRPLALARRPWRVASVTQAARATWEVVLAPVGHAGLGFRAGQFAWIKLDRGPFSRREHPFSIASAPVETGRLRFLVKEAGDFTRGIGALPPGARAYVDGPHGHLCLDGRREPGVVFLCGGVGVAPALSMIRQAVASGATRPMLLLYGNRVEAQILARAELAALAAAGGLELVLVLGEPPRGWTGATGQLDAALIGRRCGAAAAAGWLFMLCGPPPMLKAARIALRGLGVPDRRILAERFSYD